MILYNFLLGEESISKESGKYFVLEEIECPDWYQTEHLDYEGPSLTLA